MDASVHTISVVVPKRFHNSVFTTGAYNRPGRCFSGFICLTNNSLFILFVERMFAQVFEITFGILLHRAYYQCVIVYNAQSSRVCLLVRRDAIWWGQFYAIQNVEGVIFILIRLIFSVCLIAGASRMIAIRDWKLQQVYNTPPKELWEAPRSISFP